MSQMVSQAGDNSTEGGGEQRAVQSNIKKDERFDVRWEGMPFKHRKIGRGPKATYEKVCIMPLWLRNLWPTSEFDPCAVWEQAKEDEAEEEVVREKAAAAEAAAGKGSKGAGAKGKKGGGGGGKLSKKETIQAEQAKKRAEVSKSQCVSGLQFVQALVRSRAVCGMRGVLPLLPLLLHSMAVVVTNAERAHPVV